LGQQTLLGGDGKDALIGGPDDTLTGGDGPDTFAFGPGFGHNIVTDFHQSSDVIQWDRSIFANTQSVFSHLASDGHGEASLRSMPTIVRRRRSMSRG
jgi:Ca2+-binding RTX toxin-like protein